MGGVDHKSRLGGQRDENQEASEPIGIALLGSTGSIGRQTLDVVRGLGGRARVVALAAGLNTSLLAEQAAEFRPAAIWADGEAPDARSASSDAGARVVPMDEMVLLPGVDVVVVATTGRAGLGPTVAALKAGRPVALANKEALVMAGSVLTALVREHGGALRPIDSEHSAIWQCLWGEDPASVKRLILTASGGAFRDLPLEDLARVTPEQALRHPTWRMGRKITVDSATLFNKGLEVLEAQWLFDVPIERIAVVQHRESVIHSMVEFCDGSVKAQLGVPDMRLPIQCAITYPERAPVAPLAPLDLAKLGSLNFGQVDHRRFPCLSLAIEAGRVGGTAPAVLAAADEVVVDHFLAGRCGFLAIPRAIEATLSAHRPTDDPDLATILEADAWAREHTAAGIATG
jgi:1-deoxy-D-xylulose-5-phosphate reductoisomerase